MIRACTSLFFSCKPEEDLTVEHTRWSFRHGTIVNARTYDDALDALQKTSTKNYWASETLEGKWDVQFDKHLYVEEIEASSTLDAVRRARFYVDNDAMRPVLLKSSA